MSVIFKDDQDQYKVPFMSDLCGGGVNLLTSTNDFAGWAGTSFDNVTNYSSDENSYLIKTAKIAHLWADRAGDAVLMSKTLHLEKGTYTISFVAKVNGTNFPSFSVELYSSYTDNHGGLPHGTTVEKLTTAWKQYSITFSLPETTDISFRLLHYQDVPIPGGSLYFANLKLEKGPVATPWSPNPLDILNEIEALKNKIGGVVAHLQTSYMPLEMEAA